jgi:hypothetical protein
VGSQLQQEELMDVPDGSNREDNSSDTPSDTLHAVVSDGTFVPSKSKKKKKLTHSVGGKVKSEYQGMQQTRYMLFVIFFVVGHFLLSQTTIRIFTGSCS